MKTVVISQPMYFPWVGMLEQMALADVFVHLDDAQFSKGGFFNRVQIKTAEGTPWLTVPLAENKLGQALNETQPAAHDWPRKHRTTLQQTYAAAARGFSTATDLADYLVRQGVAFRDAHEVVGKAVRIAIDSQRQLDELTLGELQALSPGIRQDVFSILTLEGSVAARSHIGGTAPDTVLAAVATARAKLAS